MQLGSQLVHCPFEHTWPGLHGRQNLPPVPQVSAVWFSTCTQPTSPLQQPFGQDWGVQQGAAQKLPLVGQNTDPGAAATQTAPSA
jgi:hypothetical protein